MNRQQRLLLAAGLLLIVAVNAVVLGGVAWNRSGEPESRLTLSQRELQLPYSWGMNGERSGLSLGLLWRVPVLPADDGFYDPPMGAYGGTPPWLDAAKLRSLGIDLPRDSRSRLSSHEVLLVLELGGASHEAAIEQARRRLVKTEARTDDGAVRAQAIKAAQENLRRERTLHSRLFVIDAGLELDALRARHPDRSRFLIVRGMVRPWISQTGGQRVVSGSIESLSVGNVSIPHRWRAVMESFDRNAIDQGRAAFEADIAWGRRLEPWLSAVRSRPEASPAD